LRSQAVLKSAIASSRIAAQPRSAVEVAKKGKNPDRGAGHVKRTPIRSFRAPGDLAISLRNLSLDTQREFTGMAAELATLFHQHRERLCRGSSEDGRPAARI